VLCAALLFVLPGALYAQKQAPWWTWSTADGNWAGYRHKLADLGIAFSGTTVVDLQGNVSGGQTKAFAPRTRPYLRLTRIWRSWRD
jgi:hypothetical protein